MHNIISAILKTGIGSLANLFFGIISMKIIAIYLGPSGVGLFSLIKQTMLTFSSFGYGAQTALVQGIASKQGVERDKYVRTTFWLFVLGTLLSIAVIELFADRIAILLLGKSDAQTINLVRWIGLPSTLTNFYIFLKSLLNGYRAIGKLALVEALGPLVIMLLVYPACVYVGEGTALAFVWLLSASQVVMIFFALKVSIRNGWLSSIWSSEYPKINHASSSYFIRFAGITIVTALLSTCSILAVRVMVIRYGGLHDAGLFDVAWTLSGSYVMLLLGAFGTYFMPVLSNTSNPIERRILIRRVIRLSTLLMTPMIVIVIALKPLVVDTLYSSEFLSSLEIVRWMLIGDYLKITSWILAITVLANADMKRYFWTEIFWNIGFMLLSALAIFGFGQLQGIGAAFIFLYICINGNYLHYVYKSYNLDLTLDLVGPWLVGLSIIIAISWQTWSDQTVDWIAFAAYASIVSIFFFMALKKIERVEILNVILRRKLDNE